MNEPDTKQEITDRIKNVTNILVTVSTNPTVDELSAALGLTLMLNKLDKHTTAVFSGTIPPAITFLDPSKTFENTVDSLRDFIIALDKEKADRLRYRVEDDVVRIFITPYRTRITETDLEFTHGDFNIELVLALGVENKDVLDAAITAHGRILHDATVATINAQNKTSNLGSIAWQDPSASSLCEMLVAMSESLGSNLLDEQIATALLTGIVAATNRFSNRLTSPKSLTMAAQLMAAGANQQLIAAKLEETAAISVRAQPPKPDGSIPLTEDSSEKIRKESSDKPATEAPSLGEMMVSHNHEPEASKPPYLAPATIEEHDKENKKVAGAEALDAALAKLGTSGVQTAPSVQNELEQTAPIPVSAVADSPAQPPASTPKSWREQALTEPSMGGEFNATTKEAEEAKRKESQASVNRVILDHDSGSEKTAKAKTILPPLSYEESPLPAVNPTDTLAEIEESLNHQHPDLPVTDSVVPELNTIFSAPSGLSPTPATPAAASPPLTPVAPPIPPPPPLPDFSGLPSLPAAPPPVSPPNPNTPLSSPTVPQIPPAAPAPDGPGQFKIPGQ